MTPRTLARRLLVAAPALALMAAGCGKPSNQAATYPVKGTVTVDGKPAAHARVILVPDKPDGPRASGFAKADGTFDLSTYAAADGAPAGNYQVLVDWREPRPGNPRERGKDKLAGKYATADKSPLTAVVRPADNTLPLALTAPDRRPAARPAGPAAKPAN